MRKRTPERINWQFIVEYDYDSYTSCEESGCSEEGICRCTQIDNARATEVPEPCWIQRFKIVELWSQAVYHILYDAPGTAPNKDSRISLALKSDSHRQFIYSAGRIISHFISMRKPAEFEVEVCGGYYGQEVEGVYLPDSIESELRNHLEWLLLDAECDDPNKAILRALKYEYGYILDGWEDASFACGRMPLFAIHAMNDKHLGKLNQKTVKGYRSIFESEGDPGSLSRRLLSARGESTETVLNSLPIVLVDTNLHLVDGYHRYTAAKEYMLSQSQPDSMIWVIVSDKEMPCGK